MTRARDLADFNLDGKAVTINESSADLDFRVEGNGNANAFFVQGSDDFIGIGTGTPKKKLHIQATASDGIIILDMNGTTTDHQICFAKNYQSGGQSGGNYYAIGVDGSENKLVFAFDANAQASLSADAKVTLDSGGDLTINDGDLVIGTSGHGIDFSATSDATGNSSELLDDYEEGTFTPTLNGTSSDPTITYNSGGQQGHYTKVGNLVSFQIRVHTSAYSGGSGNLYISGLPFTASSSLDSYSGAVGLNYQWGSNLNPMAWTIDEGGSVVYLWQNNNNADVVVTGNGAASLRIRLQGFYYT